jgi:hypothetical protein
MKRISRTDALKAIWARVRKSPEPDGCWIYEGHISKAGYGRVHLDGKQQQAHRALYVATTGANLTPSQFVCHKCDSPPCVRPDHMFVGTQKENIADMIAKGRKFLTVGGYKCNSVLTEEKVRAAREWYRTERTNHHKWGLRAYARSIDIHFKTLKDAILGRTWKHLT